jgi:hypothetical protein
LSLGFSRAKEIVSVFWGERPDRVLALAMQIAIQLPASRTRAVAVIEAMEHLA